MPRSGCGQASVCRRRATAAGSGFAVGARHTSPASAGPGDEGRTPPGLDRRPCRAGRAPLDALGSRCFRRGERIPSPRCLLVVPPPHDVVLHRKTASRPGVELRDPRSSCVRSPRGLGRGTAPCRPAGPPPHPHLRPARVPVGGVLIHEVRPLGLAPLAKVALLHVVERRGGRVHGTLTMGVQVPASRCHAQRVRPPTPIPVCARVRARVRVRRHAHACVRQQTEAHPNPGWPSPVPA